MPSAEWAILSGEGDRGPGPPLQLPGKDSALAHRAGMLSEEMALGAGAWPGAHRLEWMDVLPSAQGCTVLPGAHTYMLDLSCVALGMLLNLSEPQFPQPGSV